MGAAGRLGATWGLQASGQAVRTYGLDKGQCKEPMLGTVANSVMRAAPYACPLAPGPACCPPCLRSACVKFGAEHPWSAEGHQRRGFNTLQSWAGGGLGTGVARPGAVGGRRLRRGQHNRGARGGVKQTRSCAGRAQTAGESGLGARAAVLPNMHVREPGCRHSHSAGESSAAGRSQGAARAAGQVGRWVMQQDQLPKRQRQVPPGQHSGHFHCGCCSASFAVMPTHCKQNGRGGRAGVRMNDRAMLVHVRIRVAGMP